MRSFGSDALSGSSLAPAYHSALLPVLFLVRTRWDGWQLGWNCAAAGGRCAPQTQRCCRGIAGTFVLLPQDMPVTCLARAGGGRCCTALCRLLVASFYSASQRLRVGFSDGFIWFGLPPGRRPTTFDALFSSLLHAIKLLQHGSSVSSTLGTHTHRCCHLPSRRTDTAGQVWRVGGRSGVWRFWFARFAGRFPRQPSCRFNDAMGTTVHRFTHPLSADCVFSGGRGVAWCLLLRPSLPASYHQPALLPLHALLSFSSRHHACALRQLLQTLPLLPPCGISFTWANPSFIFLLRVVHLCVWPVYAIPCATGRHRDR